MQNLKLYWVDAFTGKPFGGNAAAIVMDADELPDEKKQEIAREFHL